VSDTLPDQTAVAAPAPPVAPAKPPAKPPAPRQRTRGEILDDASRAEPKGVKAILARIRQPVGGVPRAIEDVVRQVKAAHPRADTRGIVRAYQLAHLAHQGQRRKSGERFIEHPISVARILAQLGMDATTIIAAFLHDVVEDTDLELDDIIDIFGEEVAQIIDGLTKIDKIGFRNKDHERAENLRKMIVAMARDLRVLIIKLADRLHNMRTIGALDKDKRELIASETLEIYAPLAHRLGMQQIRGELEDLSFRALHPKRFGEIRQMVAQRQPEREEYLRQVIADVNAKLREAKVRATVSGRPKHYYSIYEKMVGREREFEDIFDLVGVRIVVDTIKDCYAALGAVHSAWKPIPGRFKDYIAMPKFNLYQSLHTTVVGPEGKTLEVQIRTHDMHRTAEWGVASHWQYKEGVTVRGSGGDEQAAWMRRMMDLQHHTENDVEFLETLRLDLFADEVFVFTPRGDVVELPKGATPIDFAYAVHTEVGHSCVGARIDGRLVPLDHALSSGETVEVLTSKTVTGPSRDWLKVVVTPRARTKIKQWFTKERREEAIVEGKDAMVRAMRRAGLPLQKLLSDGSLDALARELKYANLEQFYVAVGEGRLSAASATAKLVTEEPPAVEEEFPRRLRAKTSPTQSVLVKGLDDLWVKLARCCMPVPGDPIMGFITRGRGVSIHRVDCPNGASLSAEAERIIDVAWNPALSGTFLVSIQVEALDRPKLLRDVTTTISDFGVNILSALTNTISGIAHQRFSFEVADPGQIGSILAAVRKVESIYDAYRVTPGRG
jgi:guanosine-3',5'-bis(diphosphate) 3'-pyrophosphohydrolase